MERNVGFAWFETTVRWGLGFAAVLAFAVVGPACDGEEEESEGDTWQAPEDSGDEGCTGDECGDTTEPTDTASEEDTDAPDTREGDDGDAETIACESKDLPSVTAEPIAPNASFNQPLYLTQAPGQSETLLVVQRQGKVVRVVNGEKQSPPFLDIESRVTSRGGEQGLLGMAFHPNYEENGRFFVYYTADENQDPNVVAEYERSSENPDVADPNEVRRLVEVPDTESNHNGGMIAFGPEGYLYAGLGDGGSGCDTGGQHAPDGNGQTVTNLFGTLLRLDVDAPDRDFAAPDNPFVGEEGKDQIWAYGLRNPWRFSFDRRTGDIYIGDVGQNAIEEIDVLPAGTEGGQNYGWRGYEGTETSDISGCPSDVASEIDNHVPPIYEYRQNTTEDVTIRGGESVTGGYVYRGDAIPGLRGYYLYGDYSSDDIAALRYCEGEVVQNTRLPGLGGLAGGLASFGEDNDGELYMVYIDTGDVLKLTEQ